MNVCNVASVGIGGSEGPICGTTTGGGGGPGVVTDGVPWWWIW